MVADKTTNMTNVITIEKAKKELPEIIKKVRGSKKRFLLSRQGRPQAVVLGYDDYLRSIIRSGRPKAMTRIQEEAKAKGLDKLTLKEIDAEVRTYRKAKG